MLGDKKPASYTGPDLATGDGQYPTEGKVVKTEHRQDGTFTAVLQTPTASYTLTCSKELLKSATVPLRCPNFQVGQVVHLDWTFGPSYVIWDGPVDNLPPGVSIGGARLEKTEPR